MDELSGCPRCPWLSSPPVRGAVPSARPQPGAPVAFSIHYSSSWKSRQHEAIRPGGAGAGERRQQRHPGIAGLGIRGAGVSREPGGSASGGAMCRAVIHGSSQRDFIPQGYPRELRAAEGVMRGGAGGPGVVFGGVARRERSQPWPRGSGGCGAAGAGAGRRCCSRR